MDEVIDLIDPSVSMIDNLETMNEPTADITALLQAAASGDRENIDALMVAIYDHLHQLASQHLRSERANHTLQPTALVNEAWLRLIDQKSTTWQDRNHFFAIAARVIRRILVDHARVKGASKRGAGLQRVPLEEVVSASNPKQYDLLALDEALTELKDLDERQAKIVELRFFGGLSLDEIAETMVIGRRSVDRHWAAAKAWLLFRLSDHQPGPMDSAGPADDGVRADD
jgi:RNA polymerase sigma-70 factor, ECF subfamily